MSKEDKHFWDETRKPWADLEGEKRTVKPIKSAKSTSKSNESTGFASQRMAGYFQDLVMSEAIADFESIEVGQLRNQNKDSETIADLEDKTGDDTSHDQEEQNSTAEETIEDIRTRRLRELQKFSSKKNAFLALGHGEYSEIDETDFLKCVTESPRCVVHFYHKEFRMCHIIDIHLSILAKGAIGCRFVKLNAEKSPFFVQKLKVKVLPTLVFFIKGIAVDRMTGFDKLAAGDHCQTSDVAELLKECKMLEESDESAVNLICERCLPAESADKDEDFE